MPPLSARPRQDAENKERTAKTQEQELKRARGAISCAECRRLKLKCDKTVPCSSCKRRGCASICPNGSLTTGQGTRCVAVRGLCALAVCVSPRRVMLYVL